MKALRRVAVDELEPCPYWIVAPPITTPNTEAPDGVPMLTARVRHPQYVWASIDERLRVRAVWRGWKASDAQALLLIAAVLAPYKDGTLPLPERAG